MAESMTPIITLLRVSQPIADAGVWVVFTVVVHKSGGEPHLLQHISRRFLELGLEANLRLVFCPSLDGPHPTDTTLIEEGGRSLA